MNSSSLFTWRTITFFLVLFLSSFGSVDKVVGRDGRLELFGMNPCERDDSAIINFNFDFNFN